MSIYGGQTDYTGQRLGIDYGKSVRMLDATSEIERSVKILRDILASNNLEEETVKQANENIRMLMKKLTTPTYIIEKTE